MVGSKKKIGLFGGTFDPPHQGHLKISKIAINKLSLDKLYWCVTKRNPLKSKTFFSLPNRIKQSKFLTNKVKKIKVKYFEDKIKSRKDYDIKAKKSATIKKVKKIIFIKNKLINISSTQIRNKINPV